MFGRSNCTRLHLNSISVYSRWTSCNAFSTSHCILAAAAAFIDVGEFSSISLMIAAVDAGFCLGFDFLGVTFRGSSLSTLRLMLPSSCVSLRFRFLLVLLCALGLGFRV